MSVCFAFYFVAVLGPALLREGQRGEFKDLKKSGGKHSLSKSAFSPIAAACAGGGVPIKSGLCRYVRMCLLLSMRG